MMDESAATQLMVLVFTDLVRSTDLKTRLGDAAASRLIARHDQIVRHAIGQLPRAELLKDTGDGCLARFATPSDAVSFALSLQHAMSVEPWHPEPLLMRIGIHLGEVTQLDYDDAGRPKLSGLAVDMTDRVTKLAMGGQILLTRSAFDSARQNIREHPPVAKAARPKLLWLAHGSYLFQGTDEPLEVFEVGGEGIAPLAAPPGTEKARHAVRPGEEHTLGWRPAADMALPTRPHWILTEKLGEGGFGEVWLARHQKTHNSIVLKFCFDPERLRALKREVVLFRLMKEVLGDRPDIVRVIDYQFDVPPYFLEIEHVPAGNLIDWAAARGGIDKVPLDVRLRLLCEACSAVSAAHSVGVLHKDIKPTNLLIQVDNEQPHARLTDFGIGILADTHLLAQHNITVTGFTQTLAAGNDSSRTGTRMYSPPELLGGATFTTQGDVYALGVLLYQLVVGDLNKPLGIGWERDVSDELLREDIAACVDGDPGRRLSGADRLLERLVNLPQRRIELAELHRQQRIHERRRRQKRIAAATAAVLLVTAAVTWVSVAADQASRRASLINQIATSIERMDGSAEGLRGIDENVARLQQVDSRQAADLRLRADDKLASIIAARIRQPSLRPQDLAGIETDLRVLEARNGEAAARVRTSLKERLGIWETIVELHAPYKNLAAVFAPGDAVIDRNAVLLQGDGSLPVNTLAACGGNSQATAEMAMDLHRPARLCLAMVGPGGGGYNFRLIVNPAAATQPMTFIESQEFTLPPGRAQLAILRRSSVLRVQEIDLKGLNDNSVKFTASRQDSRLSWQVNDLAPAVVEDAFPLGQIETSTLSIQPAAGSRLLSLRVARKSMPAAPNPLEQADEFFLRDSFQEALAGYRAQQVIGDEQTRIAARYKEGLCLLRLKRTNEAAAAFEAVAGEPGDRWPLLAGFQLYSLRQGQGRSDQSRLILNMLIARYPTDIIIPMLSEDLLRRFGRDVGDRIFSLNLLKFSDEDLLFAENVSRLTLLRNESPRSRACALLALMRAYHISGKYQRAIDSADQLLSDKDAADSLENLDDIRNEYSWLLRLTNLPRARYFISDMVHDAGRVRPAAHKFLVEMARIAAAEQDWQQAEKALDQYIELAPRPLPSRDVKYWLDAHLMRGFLLERKGDKAGAAAAWADGLERMPGIESLRGRDPWLASMLGSLSGKWTQAEAKALVNAILGMKMSGVPGQSGNWTTAVLQDVLDIPPAILLNMWQTPRGRDCARQLAFMTVPYRDYIRLPFCIFVREYFSNTCATEKLSPEQDEIYWQIGNKFVDLATGGKLRNQQLLQLAMTMNGITGPLGWEGVAPTLEPPLRGPLAYAMGMRYMKLRKPAEAGEFFKSAVKDSSPDSALRRLAVDEVEKRK